MKKNNNELYLLPLVLQVKQLTSNFQHRNLIRVLTIDGVGHF